MCFAVSALSMITMSDLRRLVTTTTHLQQLLQDAVRSLEHQEGTYMFYLFEFHGVRAHAPFVRNGRCCVVAKFAIVRSLYILVCGGLWLGPYLSLKRAIVP